MNERTTRQEVVTAEVARPSDRLEHLAEELDAKLAEWRLESKRDIDRFIKSIVGVMLAISMAAITIITFVLNYATPKAVPSAQPIVIYATPSPGARAP